jgi:molybdenum cofactor cytidylyltransferase
MDSMAAMILAAGGSARMGRAKQLLRIDGESLVRRTARAAIDAGCKPVMVVTGASAEAVTKEISDLPVRCASNPAWQNGMGGSIRRGLAEIMEIDPRADGVLVLLCDQPRVDAAAIGDLMAAFRSGGKPMAACAYAGTIGPPCCFAGSMFDELQRLPDEHGAKRLLLANPSQVTVLPWPAGESDLDTPTDWERFCKTNSAP